MTIETDSGFRYFGVALPAPVCEPQESRSNCRARTSTSGPPAFGRTPRDGSGLTGVRRCITLSKGLAAPGSLDPSLIARSSFSEAARSQRGFFACICRQGVGSGRARRPTPLEQLDGKVMLSPSPHQRPRVILLRDPCLVLAAPSPVFPGRRPAPPGQSLLVCGRSVLDRVRYPWDRRKALRTPSRPTIPKRWPFAGCPAWPSARMPRDLLTSRSAPISKAVKARSQPAAANRPPSAVERGSRSRG